MERTRPAEPPLTLGEAAMSLGTPEPGTARKPILPQNFREGHGPANATTTLLDPRPTSDLQDCKTIDSDVQRHQLAICSSSSDPEGNATYSVSVSTSALQDARGSRDTRTARMHRATWVVWHSSAAWSQGPAFMFSHCLGYMGSPQRSVKPLPGITQEDNTVGSTILSCGTCTGVRAALQGSVTPDRFPMNTNKPRPRGSPFPRWHLSLVILGCVASPAILGLMR